MGHLADDPLPEGLYSPPQAAIVTYARKSPRLGPSDADPRGARPRHFTPQQTIDICLTVGLSNMINRFHATSRTDLDAATTAEAEQGDVIAGSCPIPRPKPPR